MLKNVRRVLLIAGVLWLTLTLTGTALAQQSSCPPFPDGTPATCLNFKLVPETLVGDLFNVTPSGQTLLLQTASNNFTLTFNAGPSAALPPGSQAKFLFNSIQEPGNPDVGTLYVYDDVYQTVTMPSVGGWKDVVFTPTKRYLRGTLELTCDIKNYAGENVACSVSIDGVTQAATIAAGQKASYVLDPGSHIVVVTLSGEPTQTILWAPASITQTVTITASATPKKIKATFKKAGHLIVVLDQPGVVGDFYLDGTLVGTQVATIDQWVTPSASHKIEIRNLTDPAAAGVYKWKDASTNATVPSGQTKTVTVKLQKQYLKGFLELTCDIKNYAGEDVACSVSIDGAVQAATIAATQKATYILDPGAHMVAVTLSGAQASLWAPASATQTVTITASATPKKVKTTFKKAGHLIVNLDQPGVVGDFYLDGTLVGTQAASIDQWITPNVSHKVEVKNLTVTATPLIHPWKDATAAATVGSGKEKTVTIKLQTAPTEAVVVPWLNCGQPPSGGEYITLRLLWGALTRELAEDNANHITYQATLNGQDLGNLSGFRKPARYYSFAQEYDCETTEESYYWVHWDIPLGRLAPGMYLTTVTMIIDQFIFDGWYEYEPGVYPIGDFAFVITP